MSISSADQLSIKHIFLTSPHFKRSCRHHSPSCAISRITALHNSHNQLMTTHQCSCVLHQKSLWAVAIRVAMLQTCFTCINGLHEALISCLDKPPGTLVHVSNIKGLVQIPVVAIAIDGDIHCKQQQTGEISTPFPTSCLSLWERTNMNQWGILTVKWSLHKNSIWRLFQQNQFFHTYPVDSI